MNHGHHGHHQHGSGLCKMNMFLNADTTDLCILHERWRVTDTRSLVGSLLLCALLVAAYEWFAAARRRYAAATRADRQTTLAKKTDGPTAAAAAAPAGRRRVPPARQRHAAVVNAVLYGLAYLWGMTNMLIFMTCNVWVMLACSAGACVGKFCFGDADEAEEEKATSCH